jgi:hypothetical protein
MIMIILGFPSNIIHLLFTDQSHDDYDNILVLIKTTSFLQKKIKTLPEIFLTLSLPPLSRVEFRSLLLDISLSLPSSLYHHSLKSSLYRRRSSTGMKLPALPMLAA